MPRRWMEVRVYADGSFNSGTGKGGWGACVVADNKVFWLSGPTWSAVFDSNQAELQALYEGISFVASKWGGNLKSVRLYSDSTWALHRAARVNPQSQNEITSSLMRLIIELRKRLKFDIEAFWVKGHQGKNAPHGSGRIQGECHRLANLARRMAEEAPPFVGQQMGLTVEDKAALDVEAIPLSEEAA